MHEGLPQQGQNKKRIKQSVCLWQGQLEETNWWNRISTPEASCNAAGQVGHWEKNEHSNMQWGDQWYQAFGAKEDLRHPHVPEEYQDLCGECTYYCQKCQSWWRYLWNSKSQRNWNHCRWHSKPFCIETQASWDLCTIGDLGSLPTGAGLDCGKIDQRPCPCQEKIQKDYTIWWSKSQWDQVTFGEEGANKDSKEETPYCDQKTETGKDLLERNAKRVQINPAETQAWHWYCQAHGAGTGAETPLMTEMNPFGPAWEANVTVTMNLSCMRCKKKTANCCENMCVLQDFVTIPPIKWSNCRIFIYVYFFVFFVKKKQKMSFFLGFLAVPKLVVSGSRFLSGTVSGTLF